MFLQQALAPTNKFSKYILGFGLFCLAFVLGQIPIYLYIVYLTQFEGVAPPTSESDLFKMMPSSLFLFLYALSFVAVFVAFPYVIKKIHGFSFSNVITTRKKIDFKRFGFSFGIWASVLLVSTGIDYLLHPNHFVVQFDVVKFGLLLLVSLLVLPIQSTVEELLFRGYLMQGFGLMFKKPIFSLLLTSILFGLMHGFNPEVSKLGNMIMVYYIGTGLFLGILTLMDDGIELAVGFHVANNLIQALLLTTDWGALQTDSILKDISEPSINYQILLPVFGIYPILLVIFAKRYKWNNWKQKLVTTH